MKIYKRLVIDIKTLEVTSEESFEYSGEIVECKGGSGGGGGTGKIDYPDYMETQHGTWLTDVDGYMDAAIGNSPYTTAVAYVPDTALTAMDSAITAFNTVVDAISVATDYVSYSNAVVAQIDTNVVSTTHIDAQIAAYAAVLDSDYDDAVTKFTSGMRDIGAGMTSSFVFGQADIYAKKERDLTDFSKRLYIEAERQRNEMVDHGVNTLFQNHMQRVQFEQAVATLTADVQRIRVVAKGEEARENYEYDEMDAKWDLGVTEYGAAMMASIGGGVRSTDSGKMSKTQSMLSGALSGAATGAMVGSMAGNPLIGAGIGAVLGGLFGSF